MDFCTVRLTAVEASTILVLAIFDQAADVKCIEPRENERYFRVLSMAETIGVNVSKTSRHPYTSPGNPRVRVGMTTSQFMAERPHEIYNIPKYPAAPGPEGRVTKPRRFGLPRGKTLQFKDLCESRTNMPSF